MGFQDWFKEHVAVEFSNLEFWSFDVVNFFTEIFELNIEVS